MNPMKVPTDPRAEKLAALVKHISKYITEKYEEVGHISRLQHAPPKEAETGVYGRIVLPGTDLTVRYCTVGVVQAEYMQPEDPQGQAAKLIRSNPEAATSLYVQLRVASGCCKKLWEDALVWNGLADDMLNDRRQIEEVAKEFVDARLWRAIVDRTHQAVDNDEGEPSK